MTGRELLKSLSRLLGAKIQSRIEFRRETTFNNHPDLRRILMWDGYPFFPLRKDFPLEGLPSEMPDVAFTSAAPMEGGPFVTQPSTATAKDREPRARRPDLNQ